LAVQNFYLGLQRGQQTPGGTNVVIGTASNGVNSDVEVRIQIDLAGSRGNPPITTKEVHMLLESIKGYMYNNGIGQSYGTDLPPL
jgi:hypothetical protein